MARLLRRETILSMKRICLHPMIAKMVLTLHTASLAIIFYVQVMSMRDIRQLNVDRGSDMTFLGGGNQVVLDDLRLLQDLHNEEEFENLQRNKTDMLDRFNKIDRFNDTQGLDEFFFRSRQSYDEVAAVKRFFSEDKVRLSSQLGQDRVQIDKLLEHISTIFSPLYDFENQYIPYIPQKPLQIIQFRTTQHSEICSSELEAQGSKTNFVKYLPQCNLPYKNVNVTNFFKSNRIQNEEFVFNPSNTTNLPLSELCSTKLVRGVCPDYLMRPIPGGVVPVQSQFAQASFYFYPQVFHLSLYPDQAVNCIEDPDQKPLPMSQQIQRLKSAQWLNRQTRAVLAEQVLYSQQTDTIYIVQAFYESKTGGAVQKSQLVVRKVDLPTSSVAIEQMSLVVLSLCWVIQLIRLVICLQVGIGQNIINVFYMIYLILVFLLILSKGMFIILLPHKTDGESIVLQNLFSTPWFLKSPDDYDEEPMLISYRLAFELNQYIRLVELFICMLLPFQVLTLLSFFNFASPISNLMRVYTRLYPGITIMAIIGPICILPAILLTAKNLLNFSDYPEFCTLQQTFLQFSLSLPSRSFSSFFQDGLKELNLVMCQEYLLVGFLWVTKHLLTAFVVTCVAYFSYSYRKAAKFEKNMAPQSLSSQFFNSKLNDIQESLQVIQARHNLRDEAQQTLIKTFRKVKIVAWLLNRKQSEAEQIQRQKLFKTFQMAAPLSQQSADGQGVSSQSVPPGLMGRGQESGNFIIDEGVGLRLDKQGQKLAKFASQENPVSSTEQNKLQKKQNASQQEFTRYKRKQVGNTILQTVPEHTMMPASRATPSPDFEENYHQEDQESDQQIEQEKDIGAPSLRKSLTQKSFTKNFIHQDRQRQNKKQKQQQKGIGYETPQKEKQSRSPGQLALQKQKTKSYVKPSNMQQREPSELSTISQMGLQTINPMSEVEHDIDGTSYFGYDQAAQAEDSSRQSDANSGFKTETIEFEHHWQMYTFINGLFQLKPYMLTKFSLDTFRIVVEVTVKNKQACLDGLNKTLNCLVEASCCVPVMIYTQPTRQQQEIIQATRYQQTQRHGGKTSSNPGHYSNMSQASPEMRSQHWQLNKFKQSTTPKLGEHKLSENKSIHVQSLNHRHSRHANKCIPAQWDHYQHENFDFVDKNTLMRMQKKYGMLFRTSNIDVVAEFCKMEPLTQFKYI